MSSSKQLAVLALAAIVSGGAYAQFDGESRTDAQISAEVQKQIDERPELKSENISVRSAHGVVYLQGLVDTRVDQDEAAAVAAAVPGVARVYNGLAVSGNG
jgi:osmotically-inducible protein OsmY